MAVPWCHWCPHALLSLAPLFSAWYSYSRSPGIWRRATPASLTLAEFQKGEGKRGPCQLRLLGRTFSEAHFLIPVYILLTTTSTRGAGKLSRVFGLVDFVFTLGTLLTTAISRSFDWEGMGTWLPGRQSVVSVAMTYLLKILRSLDSETQWHLLWCSICKTGPCDLIYLLLVTHLFRFICHSIPWVDAK